MESCETEKNSSNKDKLESEFKLNGEPPNKVAGTVRSSMTAPSTASSLLAVEGSALQTNPAFFVKSPSGKLIPLLIKKPVLLNNRLTPTVESVRASSEVLPKTKFGQSFVIQTSSGKQVIIPNKTIPQQPSVDVVKRKRLKTNKKIYQLQIQPEEDKRRTSKKKFEPIVSVAKSPPLLVESWSQTDVTKVRDAACQTDVYVVAAPGSTVGQQPIQEVEDYPNIPDLITYLLGTPEYSTGITEQTRSNIISNTLKFKQPEMAQSQLTPKPTLTMKEQLFSDLRDCMGVDILGNMPIHNAVLDNEIKVLKRQVYALRLRKFPIDVENNLNHTALQLAILNNKDLAIIETLLSNGADVSVKDNAGNTLLHLAVLHTSDQTLELILKYIDPGAPLMNIKNDEGLTPLMVAATEDKQDSVQILLKAGVDPNVQDDKSGRTALFHAVESNNVPIINILLQNKADPKIRNYLGLTAIDAVKDQNSTVASMMEARATPDSTANHSALFLRTSATTAPTTTSTKRKPTKRKTPEQPRQQTNAKKAPRLAVVSRKIKVQMLPEANNCPSTSGLQYSQIKIRKKS